MGKSISFSDKRIKFTLHTIVWIIVILIGHYLHNLYGGGNVLRLYALYQFILSNAFIFYVGYLWLVPHYFVQNKQGTCFLFLIAIIIATQMGTTYIDRTFLTDPVADAKFREVMKMINGKEVQKTTYLASILGQSMSSLLFSGFAIGLGVMEKLKQNEKKQKELEKEKLHSELAFLKNQVSPHFFFNTLNNIYSLIGIDGPTAQDSVLKLSKLMRYLLYESEHGETLMSHEIEFMNNYIDLMKLRLNSKVELQIDFPAEFPDFTIPPLLFVPFIENAFKHGVNYPIKSYIYFEIQIHENTLVCMIKNSKHKTVANQYDEYSGIGLENIKKSLNLLYDQDYKLDISDKETEFEVNLTIPV